MADGMKENIWFIVLVFVAFGAGYAFGLYVGKDRIEDQYRDAPHRRDTTRTVHEELQPEQKKEVKVQPKQVTPAHRISADSVFALGMQHGMDSMRALFAYYTAPRETTITFDSSGVLIHQSDRLREMEFYTFQPFPRREVTYTITDSIFVPTVKDGPWYDHWYWGALGSAAIVLGVELLTK